MGTTQSLILNTTTEFFTNWLEDYTRALPNEHFPTEKGKIIAQRARRANTFSTKSVLTIDGFYVYPAPNDPNIEAALPINELLLFEILPLSTEKIEVRASCHQPDMEGYFEKLINEVRIRWSDQKKTASNEPNALSKYTTSPDLIVEQFMLAGRHALNEQKAKQLEEEISLHNKRSEFEKQTELAQPKKNKRFAPTRPADLEHWKIIWDKIRPEVNQGLRAGEIHKQIGVKAKYIGMKVSEDTLRKVISAGLNGKLGE